MHITVILQLGENYAQNAGCAARYAQTKTYSESQTPQGPDITQHTVMLN